MALNQVEFDFRTEVNDLKTWLGHTLRQMTWARANNHDKIMGERLRRDAEIRKPKLKELNGLAASLKGHSALGGQELALTVLNSDWEEMERKLDILSRDEDAKKSDAVMKQESHLSKSAVASKGKNLKKIYMGPIYSTKKRRGEAKLFLNAGPM